MRPAIRFARGWPAMVLRLVSFVVSGWACNDNSARIHLTSAGLSPTSGASTVDEGSRTTHGAMLVLRFQTRRDHQAEHILLNALGGRKTTKHAVCSACNNKFGGTIDDALASQVLSIWNLFRLKSGSGDDAPTLKKVQAGAIKINIKGDGRLELVDKPFTINKLSEDSWSVRMRVNSEEELNHYIPHIAAQLQIQEDSLRVQLANARISRISERPDAIGHQLSFGGPDAIRSMVKSGLVLWSTLVGNDEVRGVPYDATRHFIREGDEQFVRTKTNLDSRYLEDVDRMISEYGPLFNLIYVRSDEDGQVIGHFTLYNLLGWQFTLAESGGAPNRKIALISNPESPSRWPDEGATLIDIPFEWLSRPDYADEMARSKARMETMLSARKF